jgi:hypothetical protein
MDQIPLFLIQEKSGNWVKGVFNPDYALGSVMRAKNARKSSI